MSWRRAYPGRFEQVPVARRFATSLFAGSGHEDDVAFIVTELATNAIRHTRSGEDGGWFGLELVYAHLAYIGVTDLGGGKVPSVLPEPPGEEHAECGRGLRAVSELAVALGVHGRPDYGHTVWADVALHANNATDVGLAAAVLAS